MKEHIFLKSKNKSHILAVKQIKVKSGKKKKTSTLILQFYRWKKAISQWDFTAIEFALWVLAV